VFFGDSNLLAFATMDGFNWTEAASELKPGVFVMRAERHYNVLVSTKWAQKSFIQLQGF